LMYVRMLNVQESGVLTTQLGECDYIRTEIKVILMVKYKLIR
jgi:hypothetical protein